MTDQTTDAGDRCPKCGAVLEKTVHDVMFWRCGSSFPAPDEIVYSGLIHKGFWQSDRCRIASLNAELSRLRERNAVLVQVTEQWRQRAIDASIEAHRIRRTVKAPTEAEDRCITRAEVYVMCADEALAALDHPAPQKPENDDE